MFGPRDGSIKPSASPQTDVTSCNLYRGIQMQSFVQKHLTAETKRVCCFWIYLKMGILPPSSLGSFFPPRSGYFSWLLLGLDFGMFYLMASQFIEYSYMCTHGMELSTVFNERERDICITFLAQRILIGFFSWSQSVPFERSGYPAPVLPSIPTTAASIVTAPPIRKFMEQSLPIGLRRTFFFFFFC